MLLIPLIILLAVAIFTRVIEYGITEPRYILVVLSIWLTGITAYFLLGKSQNIKIIPISLCMVALVSVWGPQSATYISMRSQLKALVAVFEKNNAYKNEVFTSLPQTTPKEDLQQANDIIHFIVNRTNFESFRGHINVNIDSLDNATEENEYTEYTVMNQLLGANNTYESNRLYYYANSRHDTIAIGNYDYLTRIRYNDYDEDSVVNWNEASVSFNLKVSGDSVHFELKALFDRIQTENPKMTNVEVNDLRTSFVSRKATYSIVFENISFSVEDGKYQLDNFDGYLLVGDQ